MIRMEFNTDFECYDFAPMWACIDHVSTEGNTLEELFDNIAAFACDQDGGELGEVSLNDKDLGYIKEQITNRYWDIVLADCPF